MRNRIYHLNSKKLAIWFKCEQFVLTFYANALKIVVNQVANQVTNQATCDELAISALALEFP